MRPQLSGQRVSVSQEELPGAGLGPSPVRVAESQEGAAAELAWGGPGSAICPGADLSCAHRQGHRSGQSWSLPSQGESQAGIWKRDAALGSRWDGGGPSPGEEVQQSSGKKLFKPSLKDE